MNKRFAYELFVGLVGLIAIYFFGIAGMTAFALLALHPYLGKKKADERETQLFNKVGNITAAIMLLACIVIYMSSDIELNGNPISKLWLFLVVYSFLITHGLAGLIIFKRG